MRRSESPDRVEVVLHSQSLYRGEFTAIEDREDRPAKRWGGQYIKTVKSVTPFARIRAKGAPLFPAAHSRC
jgi:hypothetical protein